ncbi:hypothetical protein DdX_21361 [Ditylenchus destructor]|uniref:Uncharacterized protein n=1 Tax=Ditylenchus destructor TaxID=166010 RepID=A0AAD4MF37_9BILA|nr:hypothetical protein DdX_21361 [Ditylenchus destructor]
MSEVNYLKWKVEDLLKDNEIRSFAVHDINVKKNEKDAIESIVVIGSRTFIIFDRNHRVVNNPMQIAHRMTVNGFRKAIVFDENGEISGAELWEQVFQDTSLPKDVKLYKEPKRKGELQQQEEITKNTPKMKTSVFRTWNLYVY